MLVLVTSYSNSILIELKSGFSRIFNEVIIILGKNCGIFCSISCCKKATLSLDNCSKTNSLNPPPKVVFKYLSPGFVKKKLIKLFFIFYYRNG